MIKTCNRLDRSQRHYAESKATTSKAKTCMIPFIKHFTMTEYEYVVQISGYQELWMVCGKMVNVTI